MKKNIIINENINDYVIKRLLSETFYPTASRVLMIKNHLDKNFVKNKVDDINNDGLPCKTFMAMMVDDRHNPLKSFKPKELLDYLDDKFNAIIADKNDRKKFLQQIIKDWFNNKISKEGILSVNILK